MPEPGVAADDAIAVVMRFIDDVWNARRPDLAAESVAADYATHMVQWGTPPADACGAEYVAGDIAVWTAAFRDFHWHVDGITATADMVAVRLRWTGTHRGAFHGVAPTGRSVEVPGVYLARVAGGRIAEAWLSWDRLGLFQQLGLVQPTRAILEKAAAR